MDQAPPDVDRAYAAGIAQFLANLDRAAAEGLKPPAALTISTWSAEHAMLSPETSAEVGKYRAFGFQNGIADAICEPANDEVIVMKSARVGYTKILDNACGFYIHHEPSPILAVQPRVEDAEDYSRSEIAPMLRDTPVLAELVGEIKERDPRQRVAKRVFRNGASIAFVGANSPGGFRRITARVILLDEVDGYPPQGAGREGDQVALAIKRGETFWNRRVVMGSTPTLKGASRIEKAYLQSDQRRYYVPCPHCGTKQPLEWGGKDVPHGIKWKVDDDGVVTEAWYVCIRGCCIDEADKPWMIDNGEWVAHKPFKGRAGFHIWAGYSLFPNAAWSKLAAEFLRVKDDPGALQTFVNLVLGETWEESGEGIDASALAGRLEDWGDLLPAMVLVLTAGVDVQDDRIEVELIGWGVGEESWSIEHVVLYGDPSAPAIWKDLDDYLLKRHRTEDGRELRIASACVDTGGHHTQAVYQFCKARASRKVWAIKGMPGRRPVWPKRASKNNKAKVNVFGIGVEAAKDMIFARLRAKHHGPGFSHFPLGREPEYFDQLTAEKAVVRYVKGFPVRVYEKPKHARNEALDCRVYGYAALVSLNVNWSRLAIKTNQAATRRAERQASLPPPPDPPDQEDAAQDDGRPDETPPAQRPRRRARRVSRSSVHR